MTVTKCDSAYATIRQRILGGDLAPGQVLQQRELATALGISTTPLREALRRLATEGLVELDSHRDARIAALRAEQARDLLEVRLALDPVAASLAAQRRTARPHRAAGGTLRPRAADRSAVTPELARTGAFTARSTLRRTTRSCSGLWTGCGTRRTATAPRPRRRRARRGRQAGGARGPRRGDRGRRRGRGGSDHARPHRHERGPGTRDGSTGAWLSDRARRPATGPARDGPATRRPSHSRRARRPPPAPRRSSPRRASVRSRRPAGSA